MSPAITCKTFLSLTKEFSTLLKIVFSTTRRDQYVMRNENKIVRKRRDLSFLSQIFFLTF